MATDAATPNDIESVQAFFTGGVCAPADETPAQDGVTGICDLCVGDCAKHGEPYHENDGALECVKSGDGDIAFLCHNW
jgi:Transferrin